MATLPLHVGTSLETGEPFALDGAKFNRHTFWCGQSGSGKTYALGVILERLLLSTGLPMLVMDPNSDYVHLGSAEESAPAEVREALARTDVRVFAGPRATHPHEDLKVRFVELSLASRAAVLRLDPIADPEEFQVLRDLENEFGVQDGPAMIAALASSEAPARRRLHARIGNLELSDFDVWARGADVVTDVVAARTDAVVLDLGGYSRSEEPAAVALAVLERLWAEKERREPMLIVVDEAHNICPAEPASPLARAVVEKLIQIAAEGRKYGLWLLLSTQRPSKIHPQVLSQCDNLALMRMNSPADVDQLADYFGAVPRELLDTAPSATQGQVVFAGGIAGGAHRVQMGERWTRQGGSDVAVPRERASLAR